MIDWFNISPECGDYCRVITATPMRRRAAEIHMRAGQPVAEPQVADAGRPDAQDVEDNIKNTAVSCIELEQWQHCRVILDQGDDVTIASHDLHGSTRIIRFDAQQRTGLQWIDEDDVGKEAFFGARFVRGIFWLHPISLREPRGSAFHHR